MWELGVRHMGSEVSCPLKFFIYINHIIKWAPYFQLTYNPNNDNYISLFFNPFPLQLHEFSIRNASLFFFAKCCTFPFSILSQRFPKVVLFPLDQTKQNVSKKRPDDEIQMPKLLKKLTFDIKFSREFSS